MKLAVMTTLCFLSVPVLAHEITSPFYQPAFGDFLSETRADYTKRKVQNKPTQKYYRRALTESISVGLGKGWAALVQGDLVWQKKSSAPSVPHTKGYSLGARYLLEKESFLWVVSASYHQTGDRRFDPKHSILADVRFGKKLKTMTPYIHGIGQFPLNAEPDVNSPVYQAEMGVFQPINAHATLDSNLFLKYDKNIKERAYGAQLEGSYLMTSNVSLGIKGAWQVSGHAQNSAKTYCQSVGANLRFSF